MLHTPATEISDLKCSWCYKHMVGPLGRRVSALNWKSEYQALVLPALGLFHTMQCILFETSDPVHEICAH